MENLVKTIPYGWKRCKVIPPGGAFVKIRQLDLADQAFNTKRDF